jgi:hypothetical protein
MKKYFIATIALCLALLIQSYETAAFDFSNSPSHADSGFSFRKAEILDPSAIIHIGAKGEGDRQITVDCPLDGTPEGEPTCYDGYIDDTNGGCGSTPNVFGAIVSGQTICGTSGEYVYEGAPRMDADWYTLFLT